MHTVTSQAFLDCQTQETQEYHCSVWEVLSSDVLKIFAHENFTCVTFLMPYATLICTVACTLVPQLF